MKQIEFHILEEITRQWYMVDIREDGVQQQAQIHESWLTARKIVIRQTICLQVLQAVDIAKSAYSQLQDMLKVDNANVAVSSEDNQNQFKASWEPKPNRVLKITLTDGFHTIAGLEHEPCPRLQYPLNPGAKLKLTGPLVCRRGQILLTPKNVQVLSDNGIEELAREFDIKTVLAGKIGTDNVGPRINQNVNALPPAPLRDRTPLQALEQVPMNSEAAVSNEANFEEDDDFFADVELPPALVKLEPKKAKLEPSSRSVKPFEYLKDISPDDDRIHVIKGCIVTLATKLNVNPVSKEWTLAVIITDGSDSRQVDVCPRALENWIGYMPKVYADLSPNSKQEAKKAVHDLSPKLEQFNGLIKLRNNQLLELVPVNRGHLQQLKNRCSKNNDSM